MTGDLSLFFVPSGNTTASTTSTILSHTTLWEILQAKRADSIKQAAGLLI